MYRNQLNIVAALAGVSAVLSYAFLPWITVSTPFIAVIQFGISATTLTNIAGLLPGNLLISLWLVPFAGLAVALAAPLGMMTKRNEPRKDAFWQLLGAAGLAMPTLAMLYTYAATLDALKKAIPAPIPLPFETVLYPGVGYYIAIAATLVCMLTGVFNWRAGQAIP